MTLKFKTGKVKSFMRIPLELVFWIAAFWFMAIAKPADHHEELHFTFCPLANLGMSWCPGCGLGRAITHFFHGNIRESIHYHWLGIPAVLIISYRIVTLGRYEWKKLKN
ncbi:DUF2752 domain-containing protein [Pedobacter hartonius]|nr:DUF2752 domain-containing protein [Pedobacter hartonius]